MKRYLYIFLPPAVLALILSLILVMPVTRDLQPSAISPDLPLDYEMTGWYSVKEQESQLERTMLAGDTIFSKAIYTKLRDLDHIKPLPPVYASIVYSGSDMNASIHRPERCLPSQGHLDIVTTTSDIRLANGRTITFNRLTSRTPVPDKPGVYRYHINYYVFIGSHSIRTTHWDRTVQDMWDRAIMGIAQRWAYFQLGTFWGGDTGATEEEMDTLLRDFISNLTPDLIDWGKLD